MQNKSNNLLEELFTCPICYSVMTDPVTTICGHNFCLTCITMNQNECAYCRRKLTKQEITPNYQIKENIEKLKQLETRQTQSYMSPTIRRNKENNFNTSSSLSGFNGHFSPRYRVKRKYNQINFTPPKKVRNDYYGRTGFKSSGIKSQFINRCLDDFTMLEDYDIFNAASSNVARGLHYGVDISMEEKTIGVFSRRFKYN
jgi:hypothetical protein